MSRGKIFVVGLGPGSLEGMTLEAREALLRCDLIAGYTLYVNLIREAFPQKEVLATPMRQERERCLLCFEKALQGKQVALVCSGDAGVYGMAGLLLELGEGFPQVEVEVIPGVSAALSGAALLGAPLMNDFCVVSLSDLLTPWEVIERRIRAACQGDFCLVLYNPGSQKRRDHLKRVCQMVEEYRPGETVCGLVRNIQREGQTARLLSLEELRTTQVDMFTTVFIGNSQTRRVGEHMVTGRGY